MINPSDIGAETIGLAQSTLSATFRRSAIPVDWYYSATRQQRMKQGLNRSSFSSTVPVFFHAAFGGGRQLNVGGNRPGQHRPRHHGLGQLFFDAECHDRSGASAAAEQ